MGRNSGILGNSREVYTGIRESKQESKANGNIYSHEVYEWRSMTESTLGHLQT